MIIEQHYDDEVLIGLLEEADEDTHVPVCDTCTGTLESYRDLSAALHDDTVWDERELSETPAPQTTNFLRSFAERTKVEDAAAAAIVPKLLANPSLIDAHPEWRTAGVVRGLLGVVDEKTYSDPKLATQCATLSVEIADSIDAGRYPCDTITTLRGKAWRAHACTLYYTGSYAESLAALEHVDELLLECIVSDYDCARARLLRAQVYGEIERLEESIVLAESARKVFRQFADIRREAAASSTKAISLMSAGRFAEGLTIHEALASDSRIDATTRALSLHNAAICHRALSHFAQAKSLFARAIAEFDRLGLTAVRNKARWLLASVFIGEQRYEDAIRPLLEVRSEFELLGMAQDVALVSVDVAEALLMLGRWGEVVELCQSAMVYFSKAGLAYTQSALTALAYLKEAARTRTLTPEAIGNVRAYFEILPKQPHLLFAFSA